MSEQDSRQVFTRFNEIITAGEFDRLDEVLTPDYAQHEARMTGGAAGIREFSTAIARAFPDVQRTPQDVIVTDDRVVARVLWEGTHQGEFLGVPATGRSVRFERVEIFTVRDGKLAEHWGQYDLYGLLRQVEAIPGVPGAPQ